MVSIENSVQSTAGFDFIQINGMMGATTVKQISFRNNFYVTYDFVVNPKVRLLDSVYKGEIVAEVRKARTNIWWELDYYPDTQTTAEIVSPATVGVITVYPTLCLQFGWNSDPIAFLINANFNLI